MPSQTSPTRTVRARLTRERVLAGAVAVADAGGVDSLTIRSLADHLDVKPMALYHYIDFGLEVILDGLSRSLPAA